MVRRDYEIEDDDDEVDDDEEDEDEDEEDEDEEDEEADDDDDEDNNEEDDDADEQEEDDADKRRFREGLVFVGLALREETRSLSRTIKDVCKKEGLDAQQVDERLGSGEVLREIWDLIENAQFLIFDLSFERPNVYYEIGYAHGNGNHDNLLLIARTGTTIHFDVGSRRVHYYADDRALRKILRANLRKMSEG